MNWQWVVLIVSIFTLMFGTISYDEKNKREYELEMAKAGLQECNNGFGPPIWQRECKK